MKKDRDLQNCSGEWRYDVPTSMLNQMANLGYTRHDFTLCQAVALAKSNLDRIEKGDMHDELYMYFKRHAPERMSEIHEECKTFVHKYEDDDACVDVKKIAVIGSIVNGSDQADKISDHIDSLPNMQAVRTYKDIQIIVHEAKTDWVDRAFETFVSTVEDVDAIVLIPSDKLSSISWLLAYAWSEGKPAIIFTEDDLYAPLSMLALRSIQAHLKSWDEVLEYDFDNMPYKRFGDNLKGSEVKYVESVTGEQE
ncbi:hypothetical protein ABEU97_20545 [Priestia megaterium]